MGQRDFSAEAMWKALATCGVWLGAALTIGLVAKITGYGTIIGVVGVICAVVGTGVIWDDEYFRPNITAKRKKSPRKKSPVKKKSKKIESTLTGGKK